MDCLLYNSQPAGYRAGDIIKLRVQFYTGWSWISPKCEEVSKEIECIFLGSIRNSTDTYVYTKEPQMFSWGNGITVPSNLFVLYENNELGYIYKDLNNPEKWSKCIPKWEIIC
jgi:hypothetical protein